jgi:prophage antirepressor-like protein
MSDLIPFVFRGHTIHVQVDADGKPWWVAKDVCASLGLGNVSKAVARLKPREYTTITWSDSGIPRRVLVVNEPGLYRLIFRSDKAEAEAFQDWVFTEVLPSLRTTGKYEVVKPAVEDYPELKALITVVEGLAAARKEIEVTKRLALAAQANAVDAEAKADLALHSQQWLTIREYVHVHGLHRQCPEHYWGDLGRYLTGYCLEQNIPVRAQGVGDRRYATEHAYHVEVLHRLLPQWMARQTGQSSLRMLARQDTPDSEEPA